VRNRLPGGMRTDATRPFWPSRLCGRATRSGHLGLAWRSLTSAEHATSVQERGV